MTPCISIIIPVYNTEEFLPVCLDYLSRQTMKEIEILCINDGSTDRSGDILDEYAQKDSRFRVFNQPNSGPATARNKGLAEARGKYVMFCDSDDRYESNMCERMYKTIESQSVDFVMCNTNVIQLDRHSTYPPGYFFSEKAGRFSVTIQHCLSLNVLLWNKIFRKDIIDRYGISFPDGFRNDDDAFCRSYFWVAQSVYFLDEKLYHYVQRVGSIMDQWNTHIEYKDCLSVYHIAEHLYEFLDRNSLLETKGDLFCSFYTKLCRYIWTFLPIQHRSDLFKKMYDFILRCKIKKWPSGRLRKFRKAVLKRNEKTITRILIEPPRKYILILRVIKYSLFIKLFSGEKRRKYKRKKINVLKELRRARKKADLLNIDGLN